MELFAGLEANSFARGDADLSARTGIAANAGLAGPNAEYAEAAKFNPLARCQRLFQALEDCIYRCFCLRARQAGALNHLMNDVLLDQWSFLALRYQKPILLAGSLHHLTLKASQSNTLA